MRRDERAGFPQPPWVWGPSEVNEWIREAYPSGRRRSGSRREGPEVVLRLRMVVDNPDSGRVRALTQKAVESVGVSLSSRPAGGAHHRATGVFRRSVLGHRVHVSLRFDPPIHISSCKRIVDQLGRNVGILGISLREGRARLPARSR